MILISASRFLSILVSLILCLLCRDIIAESQPLFFPVRSTWNPLFLSIHSVFDGYHLTEFIFLPPSFCNSTQPDTHLFSLLFHSYFDWLTLASLLMTHISNPRSVSGAKISFLIVFSHHIDFSCLTIKHDYFLFRDNLPLVFKKHWVTLIEF